MEWNWIEYNSSVGRDIKKSPTSAALHLKTNQKLKHINKGVAHIPFEMQWDN